MHKRFLLLACLILTGCGVNPSSEAPITPVPLKIPYNESESLHWDLLPDNDLSLAPSISESSQFPEASASTDAISDPEEEPFSLSLLMVGDMLMHTNVEKSSLQEDGTYDYHMLFSHTGDLIAAADLALVNEEVILGGEELGISGYPAFNAPYRLADDLVDSGFDMICHATNHALDKGKSGLMNCLSYWDNTYPNIQILGIHDTQADSDTLTIYEKDGIKVAFLNYTYSTNGISIPADMPYCVDMLNKDKVVADIARAEAEADFTVVCPHWGTEYRLTPDNSQTKWVKIFEENGVDLVLGTHPHVIEPVEMIQNEETGHKMLVYYSLGNYVNWTSGTGAGVANRMVGGMAKVTLGLDENGNVIITDYGVDALVCHLEKGTNGVTVYPLRDYTKDLADLNLIRSQDGSFSYEYCIDLCDQVWGELWN